MPGNEFLHDHCIHDLLLENARQTGTTSQTSRSLDHRFKTTQSPKLVRSMKPTKSPSLFLSQILSKSDSHFYCCSVIDPEDRGTPVWIELPMKGDRYPAQVIDVFGLPITRRNFPRKEYYKTNCKRRTNFEFLYLWIVDPSDRGAYKRQ
ncbi:uncharacterized protein LOC143353762 [Halictus rubicundus]|uniref:uncharacterized protein LOC143353762 n=1 Tax=Halictus rubicundus TaxID=77578 RepID=UPI0040357355